MLIADEPTTALDVTVQAGILRLLRELCDTMDLAILLVTHDLGVMSAVADTVAVMRNGAIVEHGDRYQVIREPQHRIHALAHRVAARRASAAAGRPRGGRRGRHRDDRRGERP